VPRPFWLKAGELLDLGVYAPFRVQDKKLEAVFFAKNFVHSRKPEEWSFNAGDSRYQLDITDDATGNIHELALAHIPAYVNESDVDDAICIRAEHSPDGCVHYLLGHAHESEGTFVVPSDGTEVELFVNYGSIYESVRIRKGYSFLSDDDAKESLLKRQEHEDVMDVKEINGFGANEVQACVSFFLELFSRADKSTFTKETIQRALTCAAVFQRRAWRIFSEGNDDIDDDHISVIEESRSLVDLLLDMTGEELDDLKVLYDVNDIDGMLRYVLKQQFTDEELLMLADMMAD
jgi:hypothetical protein